MARGEQDRGRRIFDGGSESGGDRGPTRGGGGASEAAPSRDIIALRSAARSPPAIERLAKPAAKETEREPRPAAQEEQPIQGPREGWVRRHPVLASFGLLALLLTGAAGYLYWDYAAHFESTDDAFIAARQFPIEPEVAGYVTAVLVTDNEHVDKGEVIAEIDPRDYRVALAQAEAKVAAAQAGVKTSDAEIAAQAAQIAANQAQVDQAKAALVFAEQQATRFQQLVRKGAGTLETAQQYASQQNQQQAALASAEATLALVKRQIDTLQAQRLTAEANLAQAEADRDQARLNLSRTAVVAAQPGRVVNLSGAVGQFVQAGTSLAMFVPDDIWVTANFKETQLDRMRPGDPATIEIDAYPGRALHGHVASVQPGSGTAFSLLPAENATGNFVKIVQRVPVKILLDNPPSDVALGPGMSVVPTVRVDPRPSLDEQLTASLDQWWRRR